MLDHLLFDILPCIFIYYLYTLKIISLLNKLLAKFGMTLVCWRRPVRANHPYLWAIMEVFTPQKSKNAIRQGFLSRELVCRYTTR